MWWKIYFVVVLLLQIWAYSDGLPDNGIGIFKDLDFLFTIVMLMGLFGYAFKKRFLAQSFWKIWIFVIVVWDFLYGFYIINYDMKNDPEIIELMSHNLLAVIAVIIALIIIAFILPSYIAVYLYGFRSNDIWDRDRGSDLSEPKG